MKPRSNVRSLFGRQRARKSDKVTGRKRPVLENLEDRLLLSSLVYQAVDATPLTLLLAGNRTRGRPDRTPKHGACVQSDLNQTTTGVLIEANGFNVSLTIDASLPAGCARRRSVRWWLRNVDAAGAKCQ